MAKKKSSKLSDNCAIPATDKAQMRKYDVEDALRTVQRAEEIKKDSKLLKEVKAMAKTKMSELKKIC